MICPVCGGEPDPKMVRPGRLTEDEARVIVAIDKRIPLAPWSETMQVHPGNRGAWAKLVGEARARLGCGSPCLPEAPLCR